MWALLRQGDHKNSDGRLTRRLAGSMIGAVVVVTVSEHARSGPTEQFKGHGDARTRDTILFWVSFEY